MKRWSDLFLAGMFAAAIAGVGCGGGGSGGGLTGKVSIDGSSTVYLISQAAAAKFNKEHPKVKVTVGRSGTGGGFKRFTKGETDVSDASRPIKSSEFDQCKDNKVSFVELAVAYDGLTFVANLKNDWVEQLTVEQLQQIFLADKAAKKWSDVDPNWPEQDIKIFAPGTDSGTFDYFKEVVAGQEGSIREDMSVNEDDNVLVNGVAGEVNGIGFFGAAYYFENKDKLKVVKIVNPDSSEAVEPTPETIENGTYAPFSRPLFIYVNADSIRRPEIKSFVEFYLDHAADLSREVGYVALPAAVYDEAKRRYKARKTGTHFLTDAGEQRSGSFVELYKEENLVDTK